MADQKEPNGTTPVLGTTPPVDTMNAPVTGQLQAPAAAPVNIPPIAPDVQGATPGAAAPSSLGTPAAQPGVAGASTVGPNTHGILGEIFQTLAGGKKKEWVQTEQGPVATYRDLKPGEMARGILAAAITGLAAGYDPAMRGKGPAMSSAFSAGFKGEEAAREKQAGKEEQEAQEQFKNKTLSDEMALKKQKAAQDQLESVSRMQLQETEKKKLAQEIDVNNVKLTQEQQDRQIKMENDYDSATASGWKELDHPTTPGQTFGFADAAEAQKYAEAHGAHLIHPGEFNTAVKWNPIKNVWVPMEQPKGYDDLKQVRFAKLDKNGNPMRDPKDATKYIPDGSRDANGNLHVPAEMTNKDYYNITLQDQTQRDMKAKSSDLLAQASERLELMKKDKEMAGTYSRYAEAQGQPYAVNLKDGSWIMSDQDRSKQLSAATGMLFKYKAAEQKAQSELEAAIPGSDAEKEARASLEQARLGVDQTAAEVAQYKTKISKSGSLAAGYVNQYTDESGFNAKKATDAFEKAVSAGQYKATMTPEDIDQARKKLQAYAQNKQAEKSTGPTVGAAVLDKAKQIALSQLKTGADPEQIIQQLVAAAGDKAKFSDSDLNQIRASLQAPAGKVRMVNDAGDIKDVDAKDVSAVQAGGYKVVGQKAAPEAVGAYLK